VALPVSLDAEAKAPQAPAPGRSGEPHGSGPRVLRLGVVSYLNAAPLVHGLDDDRRFALTRELPSRVAERLHAGEIDLGMIPSIEYARGEYRIVPEIAITSRGPVRSVCLYLNRPLPDVRRVALDTSSRTSAALARVLLRTELGRDPEYVAMPPSIPEMLGAADAALVIGDPALYYEGEAVRLDLGAWWTELTGRPFVWAFWAGRADAVPADAVARLQAALRSGRDALGEIAAGWAGADAPRAAVNEAYLRGNIVYALGEAEQAGLLEFYRRAHAAGLIEALPDLRFHGRP
jgi:chorismate dehydratase